MPGVNLNYLRPPQPGEPVLLAAPIPVEAVVGGGHSACPFRARRAVHVEMRSPCGTSLEVLFISRSENGIASHDRLLAPHAFPARVAVLFRMRRVWCGVPPFRVTRRSKLAIVWVYALREPWQANFRHDVPSRVRLLRPSRGAPLIVSRETVRCGHSRHSSDLANSLPSRLDFRSTLRKFRSSGEVCGSGGGIYRRLQLAQKMVMPHRLADDWHIQSASTHCGIGVTVRTLWGNRSLISVSASGSALRPVGSRAC